MSNIHLGYLHVHIKRLGIRISQNELDFQIKSHPDYPSLLSIADSLDSFNITNYTLNISFDEIDSLPGHFLATLFNRDGDEYLCEILKSSNQHFLVKKDDQKSIRYSRSQLESEWSGKVMLLKEVIIDRKSNIRLSKFFVIFTVLSLSSIIVLSTNANSLLVFFLFILNSIGLLLTVLAWKNTYNINSDDFLNKLCGENYKENSCVRIFKSTRWKIFKWLPLSDLGFAFFSSQLIYIITYSAVRNSEYITPTLTIILILSFPILFISFYYQFLIEKIACKICLLISLIVVLQFISIYYFIDLNIRFNLVHLIYYTLIFLTSIFVINEIKNILIIKNKLFKESIPLIKIAKNYDIFMNTILRKSLKINIPSELKLRIHTSKAVKPLEITAIIDPNCGSCLELFDYMVKLKSSKHKHFLELNVILKVNYDKIEDVGKLFLGKLASLYSSSSSKLFISGMQFWNTGVNYAQWLHQFKQYEIKTESILIYNKTYIWSNEMGIVNTPVIFINDYILPKPYQFDQLDWFIADLVDSFREY